MEKSEEVENFDSYSKTPIKEGESSQGKDHQSINQQQLITSSSLVILVEFFKLILFL